MTRLSSRSRTLLSRGAEIARRAWGKDNLAYKPEDSDRYQYCLMGVVLRAAGIKPQQMTLVPNGGLFERDKNGKLIRDNLGNLIPKSKSPSVTTAQKVIEWSAFPKDAKVAMTALARQILIDYGHYDLSSYTASRYGVGIAEYDYHYLSDDVSLTRTKPFTPEQADRYLRDNDYDVSTIIATFNDSADTCKSHVKALFNGLLR